MTPMSPFEIAQNGDWHFPVGSQIKMRLVHIFQMRNGKIARKIIFAMGHIV